MRPRWRRRERGMADNLAGFVEPEGRGGRPAGQRTEIGLRAVLPEECAVAARDAHHLAGVVDVHSLRALHGAERAEVDDGVRRRGATRRLGAERATTGSPRCVASRASTAVQEREPVIVVSFLQPQVRMRCRRVANGMPAGTSVRRAGFKPFRKGGEERATTFGMAFSAVVNRANSRVARGCRNSSQPSAAELARSLDRDGDRFGDVNRIRRTWLHRIDGNRERVAIRFRRDLADHGAADRPTPRFDGDIHLSQLSLAVAPEERHSHESEIADRLRGRVDEEMDRGQCAALLGARGEYARLRPLSRSAHEVSVAVDAARAESPMKCADVIRLAPRARRRRWRIRRMTTASNQAQPGDAA